MQANDFVTRSNALAVNNTLLVNDAHTETGEVVIIVCIHARQLGSFSAYQRSACLLATLCDTTYYRRGCLLIEVATAVIIQEEQRFRALHDNVVDTHCDEVDAYGVMNAKVDGKPQLGANTICPGHEHRFCVLADIELEKEKLPVR